MHACACCVCDMIKAHGQCDCCEAMHSCMYVYQCMTKVYCHCDCCEAMHACVGVCVLAYAYGESCEAMHACIRVCVWVCTRRMLTVTAARRCMHVWEII
jgi:hypothetical protein